MSQLNMFFHPSSVAAVGASEALNAYGTRYIQALLDFGYKGKIYAVNHSGNEVLGYKIYRSVADLPEAVDLACVCVSSRFVPDVLRDCLKKGVKAAIVLSAGFRELGEEGRLLEDEIVKIAEQGIRVMGPNCFGTYCPGGGVTVVPGGGFPKQPGGTALIVQSGQLSEGITGRSFGEGIRYSKVASYGNACNINEADLLEYLMEDEGTKHVCSYLEGVRDGQRFFEVARANAGKKPLLIWKAGLTKSGAAAASSHTGSLAGGSAIWDAFFRQTRAIKINSMEELIDAAVSFSCLPGGCGPRVGLVSGGGAGAVIGADACERAGMQMPDFAPETIARLREILPPVGTSIKNPLDTGNPHPQLQSMRAFLETVAADDNVDVIMIRRIFFSVKTMIVFSGAASVSMEEQEELLSIPVEVQKKYNKPVVVVLPEELTGADDIDIELERRKIRDYFFAHNIPVYVSEQRAFTALSHLSAFRAARLERESAVNGEPGRTSPKGRAVFLDILKDSSTTVLDELRSKKIMKEYGIDVTEPVLAQSKEAAAAAADKMGYPVVMKIVSPQITHKSDIGGVKVGLKTQDEVTHAYTAIVNAAAEKVPGAVVEGVSVQKMAAPGVELVLGMNKDPQFGPVLMFGLGGTLVEILKDVTFRIVPLTRTDAGAMIREVKAYRLLEGYRGQPPVDIRYIEDLLLKVSAMMEENPEIKEMDVNPLIAYRNGAVAVDARIIVEDDAIKAVVR